MDRVQSTLILRTQFLGLSLCEHVLFVHTDQLCSTSSARTTPRSKGLIRLPLSVASVAHHARIPRVVVVLVITRGVTVPCVSANDDTTSVRRIDPTFCTDGRTVDGVGLALGTIVRQ